jgi:hypothetical protein
LRNGERLDVLFEEVGAAVGVLAEEVGVTDGFVGEVLAVGERGESEEKREDDGAGDFCSARGHG